MSKIAKGHISVVAFENHKMPDFREVRNKDWVFYGEDNLYPDYLIGLFTRNSFNNAILTGKSNFIFGKGLASADETSDPRTEAFIKIANPYESWNDLLPKVIQDYELFNGFAVEVIWGNGKPLEYYHLDFSKIRSNKDSTLYYYCDNWSKSRPQDDETFKTFEPYSDNGKGSQIFYFKHYRPYTSGNSNVYPLPDYVGCVADIETDIEITNFHYNNTKHGFSAGTMVNFNNGVPTQEKINEIEKKFKGKFSGTDKSGNIILTFNDSKDKEATVISLQPNNLDKQFEQLSARIQQNIFSGHKVTTPMLFGIKTAGQLGGRSEMLDGWEHFKNTYIHSRRHVIESMVNEFGKYFGIEELVLLESAPIGIELSNTAIEANLSGDEIRELLGYKAIEKPQANATEATLNVLNTLSPLVANKVLDSMTSNEIRALAILPPKEGGDVVAPPTASNFSKQGDDALIKAFSKVGRPADDFVVIREKKFCFHSEDEARQFFASPLIVEVSTLEQKALSILNKEPLTSLKDIAKALKIKVSEASDIVNSLNDKGYIKIKEVVNNDEPMIQRTVTGEGKDLVNEIPDKIVDISLVYQYKVAKGLGAPIIPTSREFCKELIKENKKYTRKEIEQVSNEVGYSVFMDRGGFYHNPKTGITTPYCRHEWVQQVVVNKK